MLKRRYGLVKLTDAGRINLSNITIPIWCYECHNFWGSGFIEVSDSSSNGYLC